MCKAVKGITTCTTITLVLCTALFLSAPLPEGHVHPLCLLHLCASDGFTCLPCICVSGMRSFAVHSPGQHTLMSLGCDAPAGPFAPDSVPPWQMQPVQRIKENPKGRKISIHLHTKTCTHKQTYSHNQHPSPTRTKDLIPVCQVPGWTLPPPHPHPGRFSPPAAHTHWGP